MLGILPLLSYNLWSSIEHCLVNGIGRATKDTLFHKDLCEYKNKVIAALDKRISELPA